ncbi:hypothetical protein QP568_08120 [Propionimicrobium lymphophilum]|uniref:hypothetical protein n=1 Tax=Propionimicrobium lymphophilum TaxID=33012 RepID=UPI00254E9B6C|nr:hypothetical protein [Propionimicrobium lymphophilum]MDK7710234.1 hypothetical protein [Propionimicrobium lymphophilum]MDK7734250.1 hypothetical protein [Propionimicrobium lymphophilum]
MANSRNTNYPQPDKNRIPLCDRAAMFFTKLLITIGVLVGLAALTYVGAWVAHWFMGTPTPNELIEQAVTLLGAWLPTALGVAGAAAFGLLILDQFARGQAYRAENPWYRPDDPDAPWLN